MSAFFVWKERMQLITWLFPLLLLVLVLVLVLATPVVVFYFRETGYGTLIPFVSGVFDNGWWVDPTFSEVGKIIGVVKFAS